MTFYDIKRTIEMGGKVFWSSENYEVIKDSKEQYLIHSKNNNDYIGLKHKYSDNMNGNPPEFYWLKCKNDTYNGCPITFANSIVDEFFNMLDECYEPSKVGYATFYPSEMIRTDRVFMYEAFFEYVDSIQIDNGYEFPEFIHDYWIDAINEKAYK